MERKKIYCDSNFLLDFYNDRHTDTKRIVAWEQYLDLFVKDSVLYLNIEEGDFFSNDNDFFNKLKKLKKEGIIKIKFNCDYKKLIEDKDKKHLIYFLYNKPIEELINLEDKYGLMFISKDNLYKKSDYIFSFDSFRKIDNTSGWKVLEQFKQPCNYMLLIDNFLFKSEEDVTENLKSLFDALLPNKIMKNFPITIRTQLANKYKCWSNKSKEDLENKVEEIIKQVRQTDLIKVTIENVKYSEHDRNLITNYFWFSIGYGFVLSYSEKAKTTDVHIHCITHPNVYDRMIDFENKGTLK